MFCSQNSQFEEDWRSILITYLTPYFPVYTKSATYWFNEEKVDHMRTDWLPLVRKTTVPPNSERVMSKFVTLTEQT